MRDPQRKIESSEVFASLLADMKRERPAPETLARLLGAIDAMPDAPPASAKTASKTSLLLASAALIAAMGAATVLFRDAPARHEPDRATVAERAPEHVVDPPAPAPALTSTRVADLPDGPMPATAPGARPSTTRPAASASAPAPSAGQEFEIIVGARRALTDGDHARCLSLVARYDRDFAAGQFALEASVMRIEATAAAGSGARAAELARELLAREPRNPYEARLRSLLTSIEAHP